MRILITGNMGYVGPVLTKYLRDRLPGAELIGFDTAYFGHSLTGAGLLPEAMLDRQVFGDIRELPGELLDGTDDRRYRDAWAMARPETFQPVT